MGDNQLWFDFSEFTKAANHPIRPRDFPFETAYNDPPDNTFLSVLYKNIELNENHVPTEQGWKTLYTVLALYRSKRYETVRYLLLDKSDDIVDHIAITNRIPNRAIIHPDSMTQGDYFRKLSEYVFHNDYKIIMVHNHPSGDIQPSNEDIRITGYCQSVFRSNFAGHIILDHGSFALYLPGKDWEMVSQITNEHDPLVKPYRDALFKYSYQAD
jgi:proteasome lid subunit RPN8/RPN11